MKALRSTVSLLCNGKVYQLAEPICLHYRGKAIKDPAGSEVVSWPWQNGLAGQAMAFSIK